MTLPPYGRAISDMVAAGTRPEAFGGGVVAALDWDVAKLWPRFVLPLGEGPATYSLAFCRGLDILMLYRAGHPYRHVAAAKAALENAGAHIVAPVALSRGDE